MRRFKASRWLALLAVSATACQKPYFMTEVDYVHYNKVTPEADTGELSVQTAASFNPRTVRDPESREKWEATLEEVKRFTMSNNKQIAFLGFQPAEAGTQIERALSVFDTTFELGNAWARTDQQVTNNVQTFGTGRNVLQQNLAGSPVGQNAFGVNSTAGGATQDVNQTIPGGETISLTKRNATGGQTSINYTLDYTRTNPVSQFVAVNPAWRNVVSVEFEQPLLQGAGVEFNRAPILIARANQEQAIREFEVAVQTLLRDVENAYWQLHFTYQDLYSRETGMKQALATYQKEKNELEVGTGDLPSVAQAREQYEFFRAARLQALGRVLAAERTLRELMGLPPDDDRQLVPKDLPTVAEYAPNWQVGISEAMDLRPELIGQRFAIRAAELQVFRQRNGLKGDLTLNAIARVSGLDNQFDQSIDRLTDNIYTDWVLGFRYRAPIGERAAHASVKQAQYTLSRQQRTLQNLEHTVVHDLHEGYQNLITNYELIQVQKARREAATVQLEAREQFYRQGKTTIDVLLEAQTIFADALRDESQAIVQYNQALTNWEFARGTMLINDNVIVAEENASCVPAKLLERRANMERYALPLAIHPGDRVHGSDLPRTPTRELYPLELLATPPTVEQPAAEAVVAEPVTIPTAPPKAIVLPETVEPQQLPPLNPPTP